MLLLMLDEQVLLVLRALERLRLKYMMTGSYASNMYGRLRSTFDADFVVALQARDMKNLVQALGNEFYFDAETLEEAKKFSGAFNAVHRASGLKADFYLLENGEYPRLALSRRRRQKFMNLDVWVISPEDLILAKLQRAKKGESSRQLEDVKGILTAQQGGLDLEYVRQWAARLSVQDLLKTVL